MLEFFQEFLKLDSSNVVYICRMSDCMVGLRLRDMTLIIFSYIFHTFFFLSLYKMLTFKICVGVFSGTYKARIWKLCIHMDNGLLYCGIVILTPCSYSSLLFVHFSVF